MKKHKWSIRNLIVIQCILLFLFLFILTPAPTSAGGFLAGYVHDLSGIALERVLVDIGPGRCAAITAYDGSFFSACPSGIVEVTFITPKYIILKFPGVPIKELELTLIDVGLVRIDSGYHKDKPEKEGEPDEEDEAGDPPGEELHGEV